MTRNTEQIRTEWLVLQIQSGNKAARDVLVAMWYPLLRRYARTLLGNVDDARDAVQETLLTVDRRLWSLRDPAAFPKWIYQILYRRCMDLLRSRKRQGVSSIDAVEGDSPELDTDVHTPDPGLHHDVHRAMAKLGSAAYQVLYLHYLHGLALEEISEITGVSTGTLKSRLFHARATLKQYLGGYDHE